MTLSGPPSYAIVENIPPYSYNAAVDASGAEFPLKVAYNAGKWLLHARLQGAVYPVTFQLRTTPDLFLCSIVL